MSNIIVVDDEESVPSFCAVALKGEVFSDYLFSIS